MNRRSLGFFTLATIALSGCGSAHPPAPETGDVQYRQSASAARLAYEQGDLAQAALLYRRALNRARAMNDSPSIADAAFNLASVDASLADYATARRLLREAQYQTPASSSDPPAIALLMAKVAYLGNDAAEAKARADAVIAAANGQSPLAIQAHILLGQLAIDSGDVPSAVEHLKSAMHRGAADPSVWADLNRLHGAIAMATGDTALAAAKFDEEFRLLTLARRYRDLPRALARAGDARAKAANPKLAADRFYRAARAAFAQDDVKSARAWAANGAQAAKTSGDADLIQLFAALTEELSAGGGLEEGK